MKVGPSIQGANRNYTAIALGCFAMVWLVVRAVSQSVTIDEADSYLGFAAPDWPSHWYPSSGNHVLNSIGVRFMTWLFGLSQLTLRGPAPIGAAIYILASYKLCKILSDGSRLFLPLFACFVLNPFVMDYLVAARGYSLALGFLALGFAILLGWIGREEPQGEELAACYRDCILASVCLSLWFSANFSFAYIDSVLLIVFIAVMGRRANWPTRLRLAAACVVPGILVTLVVSGATLIQWPKGQFVYGASSLRETWHSVISSSFYELNQNLVNPLLRRALSVTNRFLPPFAVSLACVQFLALLASARSRKPDPFDERLGKRGIFAGAVLTIALSLHYLQFRLFDILLPMDRTALFVVPLALVVFGALIGAMPRSRWGKTLHFLGLSLLWFAAAYFVGSLRLSYFKEWRYDADVKTAYAEIRSLNREYGTRTFTSSWMFASTLNFYRRYYKDEQSIDPFETTGALAPGRPGYVLYFPDARGFIERNKLKLVYTGGMSDIVVAIPEPNLQK